MKRDPLSISFILFAAFAFLTLLVQKNVFLHLDFDTTVRIQRVIPDILIWPLSLFSLIGTLEFASLTLLLLLYKLKRMSKLVFLFLFGLTGVFELLGKVVISQKAPPLAFLKTQNFLEVPTNYISRDFFSYPSGHSARTAFVSALILMIVWKSKKFSDEQKKIISFLVLIFDSLMFMSRIYLGEHWLSDVVGGMLLGFGLFFAGVSFSRRFSSK